MIVYKWSISLATVPWIILGHLIYLFEVKTDLYNLLLYVFYILILRVANVDHSFKCLQSNLMMLEPIITIIKCYNEVYKRLFCLSTVHVYMADYIYIHTLPIGTKLKWNLRLYEGSSTRAKAPISRFYRDIIIFHFFYILF